MTSRARSTKSSPIAISNHALTSSVALHTGGRTGIADLNTRTYSELESEVGASGRTMRIFLAICLTITVTLGEVREAFAQSKPIYFVVDASGSMQGQNKADAELLLRALSLPRDQPISITYFGRKPITPGTNLCFEELDPPEPTPRPDVFEPKLGDLGGRDDQTAITNAIDRVLENIDGPAKLIVVTDGQEGCNKHFGEILDRHPNAEIEIRQVGDNPNADLQQLQTEPRASLSSDNTSAVRAAPLLNVKIQMENQPGALDWDDQGFGERWLWFLVFFAAAASAISFGARWLGHGLVYEKWTGDIQERQRSILTGQGDSITLRSQILALSQNETPSGWKLQLPLLIGIVAAALSLVAGLSLLFVPGSLLGIDFAIARRLGWFVLSSDFSNAFAILAVTPIISAGALYIRSLQARQNFILAKNAAAEDEAKRRDGELDELFKYLNEVRSSILETEIDTRWAEPKLVGWGRRRGPFNEIDRERLAIVKRRLLEIAQGETPERIGSSKESIIAHSNALERYAPKRNWWDRNWNLPDLIDDLDKPTNRLFQSNAVEFRQLAKAILAGETKLIKAILKDLGEKPSGDAK